MTATDNERILIVDDDPQLAAAVAEVLAEQGFSVDALSDPESIDAKLKICLYDLAIVDLRMPKIDGQQVLRRIRETDPAIAVIMLTAHATVDDVVRAFRAGVADFLTKPAGGDEIVRAVRNGLQKTRLVRQARPSPPDGEHDPFAWIRGSDPDLRRQIDEARLAAKHESSVLILGETGCGKDLLAEAIHRASPRRNGPFLTTVAGARPETLVQGELFGCVKGAYTGADHASHGLIKAAHTGSLFLDEIGDISTGTQLALLRAIERKCFQPLGASHEVRADVRFISATNRDLEKDVEEGRFRSDLFYRLSEFTIRLPPLRERRADIPALVWHFAQQAVGEGAAPPAFTDDALARLASYDWPGNVRELKAEVTRAVHRCGGGEVGAEDCLVNSRASAGRRAGEFAMSLDEARKHFEGAYLRYWMQRTSGDVDEVARRAGIHPQSVRRLCRKLDLRENASW